MGTKYTTVSISGYNTTAPVDDGTVSEANKVKWSTIKTKLPDPLKTAIENIDSKLTTHFNVGPTALTTTTTLDSTHFNKVIQVSGSGVTLNLTDANTLGAGWFTDIISTDASNNVTLARATASNTINETSADVTILTLQALRVIVNAAATGFLVNTGARHSKAYKTAEDITHSGVLTMSGKTIWFAEGAAVASATTPSASPIWATDGNTTPITGTTTITGFAAAPQAGAIKRLVFDGALTLQNGANLICPGNADILTASGDSCIVYADTTTQFRIFDYTRASGVPLAALSAYGSSLYFETTLASPMVEATAYSASHGLGATPKLLQLVLKCLTTELGYAVDDEVQIVGNSNNTNNMGALSCWASATQVGATTHASGYVHSMTHKTTGSPANATVGNWALIIRAWK